MLNILNSIAETRSKNKKLEILNTHSENELLKQVFYLTYSPDILFGVKKYNHKNTNKEFMFQLDKANLSLEESLNLLKEYIVNGVYSGNKAISFIEGLSARLTKDDAEVLRRIINRDLEIGAGVTLANSVYKDLIYVQKQCLSNPFSEKNLKAIKFPALSQIKEDGARCFIEVTNGKILMRTRSGNLYHGLDNLTNFIEQWLNVNNLDNVVIDGELIVVENGERVDRKTGNGILNKSIQNTISIDEQKTVVFRSWDLIDYEQYSGVKSLPYIERLKRLENSLAEFDTDIITVVEYKIVNNVEEAKLDFIEKLNLGLEGTILKNKDFIWYDGRKSDQIKFKLEEYIDLEIVDYTLHTKDENKLGSFKLKTKCGLLECSAGSGLTDTNFTYDVDGNAIPIPFDELDELNRVKLLKNIDSIIGKIIMVKTNGPLKSKSKEKFSLFLPIIEGFRHDKTEANDLKDVFPEFVELNT